MTSALVGVLEPKSVFGSSPNLVGRKWRSGLNRISHPDWVKLSVELNCAPNQNTKFFLSLQTYNEVHREDKYFIENLLLKKKKKICSKWYVWSVGWHPVKFSNWESYGTWWGVNEGVCRNDWKHKQKISSYLKLNVRIVIFKQSHLVLFTNPSARAGYDTRSIF